MIVLDASAAVELLLNTRAGRYVRERIAPEEVTLHAPHLIDLEVAQCLRRYVSARLMTSERGRLAVEHMRRLDVARYSHDSLLDRIWKLRENLTAYDAAYVALAEALDAPLLTCDRKMAAAPGHNARIAVVGASGRH